MRAGIPARLEPYLRDLLATGLFGASLGEVVVRCVERQVQEAVKDGWIPPRVNGKVRPWRNL